MRLGLGKCTFLAHKIRGFFCRKNYQVSSCTTKSCFTQMCNKKSIKIGSEKFTKNFNHIFP